MKELRASRLSYQLIIAIVILFFLVLVILSGSDVASALGGFFRGAFGSAYAWGEVLVKATPLILCGLSVSCGFFSGFTNIGAEGQFLVGAAVTTALGMYGTGLPPFVLGVASLVLGFLAGGVWAMIPGILKAKFGISEVINTLMFNYIATGVVGILLQTVLKSPTSYFPVSSYLPKGMWLPVLVKGTRLHAGLLIALGCAWLVSWIVWKTWLGFRLRAVGCNPRACQCAGINVPGTMVISSLLSGGFAGVAGVCEVIGLQHRLLAGISPGYGYLAIVVALLGGNHAVGIVGAAIGIAIIQVGSQGMQRSAGVPTAIANIILGGTVLLLLMRPYLASVLHHEEGT